MSLYLDDNLEQHADGSVICRHCGYQLGSAVDPLLSALVRESASASAGPSVREDPTQFADREVILRRTLCPGCLTQLQAEIVPADEPSSRHRSVAVTT